MPTEVYTNQVVVKYGLMMILTSASITSNLWQKVKIF